MTKSITFPNLKVSKIRKLIRDFLRVMKVSLKDSEEGVVMSWDNPLLNYDLQQSDHITRFAIWFKGSKRFIDIFYYEGQEPQIKILLSSDKLK